MTLLDNCEKWIAFEEGCDLQAYWDKIGHVWTIGFGHTGVGIVQGLRWSHAQAVIALDADISLATSLTRHIVGRQTFDGLDPVRKAAFVNMGYNLGNRLAEFDDFLEYAREGDWVGAGHDLLTNTLWAKQLPNRAGRVANALVSGEWPNV